MRTSTRLLVGLAAAGAVAAGGSAYTAGDAGMTTLDNVAGYGEATVTGATASSIKHNLTTNGQSITSSVVVFSAALKNSTVARASFNGATQVDCVRDSSTQVTCTYASPVTTTSATTFAVSVS